jgi:hypothetical protein
MPHVSGKIRVKRKGSGPMAVTTDDSDQIIGEKPATLEWIKRPKGDGDPGDDFAFAAKPIESLPDNLFKIVRVQPHKVTVAYAGYKGARQEWKYWIHVMDVRSTGDKTVTTSDGSATIKNK